MSYVKPHEILDVRYKNVLANTDVAFYTEWCPEKKGKLNVSMLGQKSTWALSQLNSELVFDWDTCLSGL